MILCKLEIQYRPWTWGTILKLAKYSTRFINRKTSNVLGLQFNDWHDFAKILQQQNMKYTLEVYISWQIKHKKSSKHQLGLLVIIKNFNSKLMEIEIALYSCIEACWISNVLSQFWHIQTYVYCLTNKWRHMMTSFFVKFKWRHNMIFIWMHP